MGIQLMEYARQFEVAKFVAIGTICAYPKFAPVPLRKKIFGMVTLKKPMLPMGWRKR
jgi:hypothetical protein